MPIHPSGQPDMRKPKTRKPPKARGVFYQFVGPFTFDVDAELHKAEKSGVISQWDDGRGDVPWFIGPPGEKLRELKRRFLEGGGLPYGRPYTHPEQREKVKT